MTDIQKNTIRRIRRVALPLMAGNIDIAYGYLSQALKDDGAPAIQNALDELASLKERIKCAELALIGIRDS